MDADDEDALLGLPSDLVINIAEMRRALTMILRILGLAAVQIGHGWRSDLKKFLDSEFHPLCDKSHPVKQHLFPDDLQKEIDDISKLNKLAKKVSKKKKFSSKPNAQNNHFLGRASYGNNPRFFKARFTGQGRPAFRGKPQYHRFSGNQCGNGHQQSRNPQGSHQNQNHSRSNNNNSNSSHNNK